MEEFPSNSENPNSQKMQKLGQEETLNHNDRLSQLPYSILLRIIDFLHTFDVVFRLGLVSKRLASLKTSLPSFVFRDSNLHIQNNNYQILSQNLVNFVDETFILQNCHDIKRFSIEFDHQPWFRYHGYHDDHSKLDMWIRSAIIKFKVEELELLFQEMDDYSLIPEIYFLPKFMFRNEIPLTRLNLRRVGIKDSGKTMNWKFLKSLCINHICLDDATLQNILLCSPVLARLELAHCHGIKKLEIVSKNLKVLKLHNCRFGVLESGDMLKISASSLQNLAISGFIGYKKCKVKNFASLEEATLNYERSWVYLQQELKYSTPDARWWPEIQPGQYDNPNPEIDERNRKFKKFQHRQHVRMAQKFFRSVQYVSRLTLGTWSLQALSIKTSTYVLSNCKRLTLVTKFMQWDLPGIASLLENCPKLESLTIDMRMTWSIGLKSNDINYDDVRKSFWVSNPSYGHFSCLQQHLKTVKILGLVPHKDGVLVTEFLQFLMKYARVLEKLSVCVDSRFSDKQKQDDVEHNNIQDDEETLFQLSVFHMLLSFPKSSSVAVIEVSPENGTKNCSSA